MKKTTKTPKTKKLSSPRSPAEPPQRPAAPPEASRLRQKGGRGSAVAAAEPATRRPTDAPRVRPPAHTHTHNTHTTRRETRQDKRVRVGRVSERCQTTCVGSASVSVRVVTILAVNPTENDHRGVWVSSNSYYKSWRSCKTIVSVVVVANHYH